MAEYQHVKGLAELTKTLREFAPKVRKHVLGGATGAAARVIRDRAKENAPVYHGQVSQGHPPPGTLKRLIKAAHSRRESTDTRETYHVFVSSAQGLTRYSENSRASMRHQLRAAVRSYIGDAYYWGWVEFGSVHNVPVAFMRRAFQSEADHAISVFREKLSAGVQQQVEKSA